MAKPICIIYFPDQFYPNRTRRWIYDYMRFLNGDVDNDEALKESEYYKDYYWFCFYKIGINEPEFKVFYEKDFSEIKFEELKQLVLESVS